MSAENKYERVDERDPNRCRAVIGGVNAGQCFYKAIPGGHYCAAHGGTAQQNLNTKARLAQYRLGKYQERTQEFADHTEIKSLREEIGIVRMVLETIVTQCDSVNKLVMFSSNISHLVGQINQLIVSAQKLEEKNNNLLDRRIVIVIADSIVTLIGEYIDDSDKLDEIGKRICESITAAASPANNPRLIPQSDNAA